MKILPYALVPAALVAAVVLAGCGGGGGAAQLGAGDVAVVGGTKISKGEFDDLMATAQRSYKSSGKTFPKEGTQAYQTLKSQAVTYLVQQAEREQKAVKLGITVTQKQIDDKLATIKKTYFGGSQAKYETTLKQQGLSEDQLKRDIRSQLVSTAVFTKVTAGVKVSDAEVHAYYLKNISQYKQAESRDVRHVLVKTKAQADTLWQQLKAGDNATWCKLAKKYSKDTGSKDQCGKLTIQKGQTVPEFDAMAFRLKTREVSRPVKTTYGWHIIQALSAIKPPSTTPEKQVASTIRSTVLQTKKNEAMSAWVSDTEKEFCKGSDVKYQAGYTPNPNPCTTITTSK